MGLDLKKKLRLKKTKSRTSIKFRSPKTKNLQRNRKFYFGSNFLIYIEYDINNHFLSRSITFLLRFHFKNPPL